MTEAWTWTYAGVEGEVLAGSALPTTAFPTQSDAEAWLSESWEDLGDEGVQAVSLCRDGALVYGPMSLQPGT